MVRAGIIGYGYWGPNLVRNFYEAKDATVTWVSDRRQGRLEVARARYPTLQVTRDHRALIQAPDVDLVVIATPVATHFELALQALRAGKHVLVEKPLASTSEQVERLQAEADRVGRLLLVDHTFVFTGAVRKMRDLAWSGELGELYYYDAARVNLGLFQHDVNVIWDLAVHDLSILDYVVPDRPVAVSATGISHVPGGKENVAFLTLFFSSTLIAHVHVNWLAPVKLRRTLLGASRKMVVYDDLEASEKIKIYDKGITIDRQRDAPEAIYDVLVGYRTGDMLAPTLDTSEALQVEVAHVVRCVQGAEAPRAGADAGLRVVEVLEAATLSMASRGRPVELRPGQRDVNVALNVSEQGQVAGPAEREG